MQFTDSHCHLDFSEFDNTRASLLNQCFINKVTKIIIPAIAPSNWQKVLKLASNPLEKKTKNQTQLYAALGIHPWFLADLDQADLTALDQAIATHLKDIIAIGETGIDLVIANNQATLELQKKNLDKQINFFHQHLQLANEYNLPVIVHHRRSHQEVLAGLKKYKVTKGGIIHAFSGSYQQAIQYIDLGFKLGIGGTITYPRAIKTIKAVKRLPLSSLVLETDAPAMPLSGYQGEVNSPLRVIDVFKALCQIRDEKPEEIALTLENNIAQLFTLY